MDKRIKILNRLKNKLNNYIAEGNSRKEDWTEINTRTKEHFLNNSRLQAQMFSENIKLGIVMREGFLLNSNVFAESNKNGVITYHIYPSKILNDSQEDEIPKKEVIKYANVK
jgi:hypothetical protein